MRYTPLKFLTVEQARCISEDIRTWWNRFRATKQTQLHENELRLPDKSLGSGLVSLYLELLTDDMHVYPKAILEMPPIDLRHLYMVNMTIAAVGSYLTAACGALETHLYLADMDKVVLKRVLVSEKSFTFQPEAGDAVEKEFTFKLAMLTHRVGPLMMFPEKLPPEYLASNYSEVLFASEQDALRYTIRSLMHRDAQYGYDPDEPTLGFFINRLQALESGQPYEEKLREEDLPF